MILAGLRSRCTMPWLSGHIEAALELFKQLMDTLADLHSRGIVHRDLKPANIILTLKDGTIKVIDFGLSRMESGSHSPKRSRVPPTEVPTPKAIVGTPGYAPPEHCITDEAAWGRSPSSSSRDLQDVAPSADVF